MVAEREAVVTSMMADASASLQCSATCSSACGSTCAPMPSAHCSADMAAITELQWCDVRRIGRIDIVGKRHLCTESRKILICTESPALASGRTLHSWQVIKVQHMKRARHAISVCLACSSCYAYLRPKVCRCSRRHGRIWRCSLHRLTLVRHLESVHGAALLDGVRLAARRQGDDVLTYPHPVIISSAIRTGATHPTGGVSQPM